MTKRRSIFLLGVFLVGAVGMALLFLCYAQASSTATRYTSDIGLPIRRVDATFVLVINSEFRPSWLFRYQDASDDVLTGSFFSVYTTVAGRLREDLSSDKTKIRRRNGDAH